MNGAAAVRGRYRGGRALGYDERRSGREFWAKEYAAVRGMLEDITAGAHVLDIPVGTARYAPIYDEFGFQAVGIDVSPDMLAVARAKVAALDVVMDLREGDALAIDAEDRSFDAVVCTRFLNWILPDEMVQVLGELMRVCRHRLIVSIELAARTSEKGNKPQDPQFFAAALEALGGRVEKRLGIETDYWMLQIGKRA